MLKPQHIFLVHGIRAKDRGAESMGVLAENLKKTFLFITEVVYGYVLIPITNKKATMAVVNAIKDIQETPGDIVVVAYSNGAWAALQAAEMGYRIDHLVMISPALHRNHAIPEQIKRVDVFHSSGDEVVVLAKYWRKFANLMPWNWELFGGDPHDWGSMGKYGYGGNDPRVYNWEMRPDTGHFWYKHTNEVERIANHIRYIYNKELI